MKLVINGYTVSITAKQERPRESTRKEVQQDTMGLLCDLSLALYAEAESLEKKGCPFTATNSRAAANDIYDALDKAGYFRSIYETA